MKLLLLFIALGLCAPAQATRVIAKILDDSGTPVFLPSAVNLAVAGPSEGQEVRVAFDEVNCSVELSLGSRQLGVNLKRFLAAYAAQDGQIQSTASPIEIVSMSGQSWSGHLVRVTLVFRRTGNHPPIFLRALGKFRVYDSLRSVWLPLDDEVELHFLARGERHAGDSVSIGNRSLARQGGRFRLETPDGAVPLPKGIPLLQQRIDEFFRPRWADLGSGYEPVHLVQYAQTDLMGYAPVQVVRAADFEVLRRAAAPMRISVFRLRRPVLRETPPIHTDLEAFGLDPTLQPWILPIGAILVGKVEKSDPPEFLAATLIQDCDDWQYRLTCDAHLQKASQRFIGTE